VPIKNPVIEETAIIDRRVNAVQHTSVLSEPTIKVDLPLFAAVRAKSQTGARVRLIAKIDASGRPVKRFLAY